ncbi:hypothetical protein FEM03_05855 [Phragmitibacter flavus]|uniref:Uncharacterized protein n=1 Tax=Phragmitibacter flavus TaxID=2576071 RepID=A0A5R8KHE6_9BACT|nr:hypothetical protein [Phragmitibacter flavus]TLD71661.1 hypothetical protein FEM03_05855 [Phragmitibacter flavus]
MLLVLMISCKPAGEPVSVSEAPPEETANVVQSSPKSVSPPPSVTTSSEVVVAPVEAVVTPMPEPATKPEQEPKKEAPPAPVWITQRRISKITDSGVQAIPAGVVVEVVSSDGGTVRVKYNALLIEAPQDAVIQQTLETESSKGASGGGSDTPANTSAAPDNHGRPNDLETNNQLSAAQVELRALDEKQNAEVYSYHQSLSKLRSETSSSRSEDRRDRASGRILGRGDKSKKTEDLEAKLQQAESYLVSLRERHATERAPIELRISELRNQINHNLLQYHREMSEQHRRTRLENNNPTIPTSAP